MITFAPIPELDILLAKRDVKKAEVLITRYLRSADQSAERAQALIARSRIRLIAGRLDDALEDLKQAQMLAAEMAETPPVLELLGDCHFARFELAPVGFADRADTAAALSAYQDIQKLYPEYENLGWVYYQLGRVMLTENQVSFAIEYFQDALLSASDNPALTAYCYERLGFVYFYELRELSRAFAFLNKAIDTYPDNEPRHWLAQVHTLRSRVLRDMARFPEALAAADLAVSISTTAGVEGRIGLADASLAAAELAAQIGGSDKEVIAYLNLFLQHSRKPPGIDVTWSRAHELLGDAQWRTGQPQPALTSYQAALEYNPYHPWEISLYYRIARCYYQLGEFAKAIQRLEKMLDIARKDGEIISDFRVLQLLANAYFTVREYEKAAFTYQLALELVPAETDHVSELAHYMHLARNYGKNI
ncbi:MAG: tetratricopeptide repeat protein [Anaerolineae bacterium]|nr:tetratricopeptide repeat protein [Anaerolineae bacterium]